VVRIQEDRDHTVCDTGPYRLIRHPGYAGGILFYLITPIVLNAMWAFIPMGISVAAIVIRTALEDKALQNELEGYQEYTWKTRYRLVPGIW
jgi:protein-S-isoprenylcysteine O-methyltransferase Ste14